jgi:uncharacterized protein YjbI with pentapeptide repeats
MGKRGGFMKDDELEDAVNAVEKFTYAIDRIQKRDATTFDLMAKNALQFYQSYQSKDDVGETIKRFFGTLFYFLAFAISHPKLTDKLVKSLTALHDPGNAKNFALQIMKSDKVWSRIVNNQILRPHIINLATEVIRESAVPSYEAMKREYQKNHELGKKASYTTFMYYDELIKNVDLPIGKKPPDYPALGEELDAERIAEKRAYIDAILKVQHGYIEILKNPKTVNAALKAVQAFMTNKAVSVYLEGREGIIAARRLVMEMEFPSYESLKARYKGEEEYTDEKYRQEVAQMELPNYAQWVKNRKGEGGEKAELLSKKRYIEEVSDGKLRYLAALGDPSINLAAVNELSKNPSISTILNYNPVGTALQLIEEMEFPSYETLKAQYKGEEGYTYEKYLKEVEQMELPNYAQWVENRKDRGVEKAELLSKGQYIEEVLERKVRYLMALGNPSTNLAAAKELIEKPSILTALHYTPEKPLISEDLLPVVDIIFAGIEYDKLDLILEQLPFIINNIPALQDYIPAYVDLNELINVLSPADRIVGHRSDGSSEATRKATFELIKIIFERYKAAENKKGLTTLLFNILKEQEVWDKITAHPTLKDYVVKVGKAFVERMSPLSLEDWLKENPQVKSVEDEYRMYIENFEAMQAGYIAILNRVDMVDIALQVAKGVAISETANKAAEVYVTAPVDPDSKALMSDSLSHLIKVILSDEVGFDKLDPLMVEIDFIAHNIQAIRVALPNYIDLDELTKAILDPDKPENRKAAFELVKAIFSVYGHIESIYAGNLNSIIALAESEGFNEVLERLTKHSSLMPYAIKVVEEYIKSMDMSKPSTIGQYMGVMVIAIQYPAVWKHIINNESLRPSIISIAKIYLTKVADMTFDERKIVYDRAHKNDKPPAPDYTQEMYVKEKAAAEQSGAAYIEILENMEVMSSVLGVVQPIITDQEIQENILGYLEENILGYLEEENPQYEGLLPKNLVPIVQSVIQSKGLEALIANLSFIFRRLAPGNFAPNAPEFGEGYIDKALLGLIEVLFDPEKREEWPEVINFLKTALIDNYQLINVGVASFKQLPLFDAATAFIGLLNSSEDIKQFIEGHPNMATKLVRYIVSKMFDEYCVMYGVKDKFWDILDILCQDMDAVYKLFTGLREITDKANFASKDGTEKAVDIFVRELVALLKNPKIGPQIIQFIKDNREVVLSLIDGVLTNIPSIAPYIRDFVFGLGLTTSDILDQITHNPDDLIKLINIAKDTGALRGEFSKQGIATALANKAWNVEGLGIYSPVVQQVIVEVTKPYIPQTVVDWTPQWFKNFIPGGKGEKDKRGKDFAAWIIKTINENKDLNLHEVLTGKSGEVNEFAREFVTYKSLSKLDFKDNNLALSHHLVEGFSFAVSKSKRVWAVNATIIKTDFSSYVSKDALVKGSKLDGVNFDKANFEKLEIKGNSVISNTSFKGMKVHSFTIESSELRNVDFTGLGFINFTYSESLWRSHHIVKIENSTIDDTSLQNLLEAAKAANFNVELHNVIISKNPEKEVELYSGDEHLWMSASNITIMPGVKIAGQTVSKVAEYEITSYTVTEVAPEDISEITKAAQTLMEKYSKECTDTIIKHLKSGEVFMSEGLGKVEDEDLREFLELVIRDAFSKMPQEKLMYTSKMPIQCLSPVLINDDIIWVLDSVYDVNEQKEVYLTEGAHITFGEAVRGAIDKACSEKIEKRGAIEPRDIWKHEDIGRGK